MEQLLDTLGLICDKISISKETDVSRVIDLIEQINIIVDQWEIDPVKELEVREDRKLMDNMFPYYWLLKNRDSINNDH